MRSKVDPDQECRVRTGIGEGGLEASRLHTVVEKRKAQGAGAK